MKNRVIQSRLFSSFSEIEHGFLTRHVTLPQRQGINVALICRAQQVHGISIVDLRDASKIEEVKNVEADILLTKLSNVALTILTADCVPLLFYDPKKQVVAASHAGWRGSAKGVSSRTIEGLKLKYKTHPNNLRVAIGPSIGPCCYEVDQVVFDQIQNKAVFTPSSKEGHWKLDLGKLNRIQCEEQGVPSHQIEEIGLCTVCNASDFYSYRREGEKTGRQWSFIALTPQNLPGSF